MSIALLVGVTLLGQSTAARTFAEAPAPRTRPTVEADPGDGEGRRICRMEAGLGTNIRQRVCRTEALIDRERQEAQAMITRRQGLPNLTPGCSQAGADC